MKKYIAVLFVIIAFVTSGYVKKTEQEVEKLNIKEDEITSQPYKVELIDDKTPQIQNSITLKVANDVKLYSVKVGDKILFTLPSTINLEGGGKIESGTKFSATVVMKKGDKIKLILNEIIFTDTKSYIILSNPKDIEPLKTISAERILGEYAKVDGTFRLGTVISSVNFFQKGIKSEPDTTTAVGVCIMLKTRVHTLKAGTPVTITFEKNIKPEVGLL